MPRSQGWQWVSWDGYAAGLAPSDDEGARDPSTLMSAWRAYMAASGAIWKIPNMKVVPGGEVKLSNLSIRASRESITYKERGRLVKRNDTQYDLYLRRGDLSISMVEDRCKAHPYVQNKSLRKNGNKLLNTQPSNHEALYNLRFQTQDDFQLHCGYTREGDGLDEKGVQVTHLWCTCSSILAPHIRKLIVDLIFNLGGYYSWFSCGIVQRPPTWHCPPVAASGAVGSHSVAVAVGVEDCVSQPPSTDVQSAKVTSPVAPSPATIHGVSLPPCQLREQPPLVSELPVASAAAYVGLGAALRTLPCTQRAPLPLVAIERDTLDPWNEVLSNAAPLILPENQRQQVAPLAACSPIPSFELPPLPDSTPLVPLPPSPMGADLVSADEPETLAKAPPQRPSPSVSIADETTRAVDEPKSVVPSYDPPIQDEDHRQPVTPYIDSSIDPSPPWPAEQVDAVQSPHPPLIQQESDDQFLVPDLGEETLRTDDMIVEIGYGDGSLSVAYLLSLLDVTADPLLREDHARYLEALRAVGRTHPTQIKYNRSAGWGASHHRIAPTGFARSINDAALCTAQWARFPRDALHTAASGCYANAYISDLQTLTEATDARKPLSVERRHFVAREAYDSLQVRKVTGFIFN